MAEHTRGQNIDGRSKKRKHPTGEGERTHSGSHQKISANRSSSDRDAGSLIGRRGTTRESEYSARHWLIGNDYDGQLSDE